MKEAFAKLEAVSEKARLAALRANHSFPQRTRVYTPSTCHHNRELCATCHKNPDYCRHNSVYHPSMTQPAGVVPAVELFVHVRPSPPSPAIRIRR